MTTQLDWREVYRTLTPEEQEQTQNIPAPKLPSPKTNNSFSKLTEFYNENHDEHGRFTSGEGTAEQGDIPAGIIQGEGYITPDKTNPTGKDQPGTTLVKWGSRNITNLEKELTKQGVDEDNPIRGVINHVGSHTLVYRDPQGKILGAYTIDIEKKEGVRLLDFRVLGSSQRQGIGTKLMQAAAKVAVDQTAYKTMLHVGSVSSAIPFYQKHGSEYQLVPGNGFDKYGVVDQKETKALSEGKPATDKRTPDPYETDIPHDTYGNVLGFNHVGWKDFTDPKTDKPIMTPKETPPYRPITNEKGELLPWVKEDTKRRDASDYRRYIYTNDSPTIQSQWTKSEHSPYEIIPVDPSLSSNIKENSFSRLTQFYNENHDDHGRFAPADNSTEQGDIPASSGPAFPAADQQRPYAGKGYKGYDEESAQWVAKLTPEEQKAAGDYTGSADYERFNKEATEGNITPRVKALDDAIAKAGVREDPVRLYRRASFTGTGQMNEGAEQKRDSYADSLKPGDEISLARPNSFQSASITPRYPMATGWPPYSIMYEINARSGAPIGNVTQGGGTQKEREVLLPRDATFRVIGVQRDVQFGPPPKTRGFGDTNKRLVIQVEEIVKK